MSYRLIVSRTPDQVIVGSQALREVARILNVPGPARLLSMHAAAFDVPFDDAEVNRRIFELLQRGYGVRIDLDHAQRRATLAQQIDAFIDHLDEEEIGQRLTPAIASHTRSEEQPGRSPGS